MSFRHFRRDQAKQALKNAWPALKLTLTVLEKTLDGVPIPGLKGAVGGFLELAKIQEVRLKAIYSSHAEISVGIDQELRGRLRTSDADGKTHHHSQPLERDI